MLMTWLVLDQRRDAERPKGNKQAFAASLDLWITDYCLTRGVHLGRFPKVRTSRPDHGRSSHFENEIGFFEEFLMTNDFLRAHYLAVD